MYVKTTMISWNEGVVLLQQLGQQNLSRVEEISMETWAGGASGACNVEHAEHEMYAAYNCDNGRQSGEPVATREDGNGGSQRLHG